MTNLTFVINSKNFLSRTDAHPITNQTDEEYICHFTFENEEWEGVDKFASFTFKKKVYTAILGTELECSTPIPYDVLKNCITTIKVFSEDLSTRNQISLVISQPKSSSDKQCPEQDDFRNAFAEAYSHIKTKIDRVETEGTDIVFYADGKEVSRLSFGEIIFQQPNWTETDETSSSFIRNKPTIIDNILYQNGNLVLLSNGVVQKRISMHHTHITNDITDFNEELNADLNSLIISITENIRSL